MPLYVNKGGELRRVIPGRPEDKRLSASPDWQQISDADLADVQAGKIKPVDLFKSRAADAAKASKPAG